MKYINITEKNGDLFTDEFDSLEDAKKKLDYDFAHMTELEKKKCAYMYTLESVNPDEDAENHFDGDPVYELI